jgi:acetylornithine/N-succinyldiaminopimelate aminotransferase
VNTRQLFLQHVAQTSPSPIAIEPKAAQGIYITDVNDKKYIDGISGFSVANIGHSHPQVIEAVKKQAELYMHLIVYGEFVQQPQVAYAKLLTDHLPKSLDCVYFTNSGAEAIEGAMKLAKRVTHKTKVICFNNAYHGSTQGALSLIGSEYWRNAFRPLLPDIIHLNFNSYEDLQYINADTACVIVEPIQAEAGVVSAEQDWLQELRKICNENCALLIFDEIQSGFGRTGKLFAFEHYNIVPDVLVVGKALGGGMPLGAFISSQKIMSTLTINPVLGHITTFGGHPVSCAAGKAALEVLINNNWINKVKAKQTILQEKLQHKAIIGANFCGLWAAIKLKDFDTCVKMAHTCIANGLVTDWFLFAQNCIRIAPPLCIENEELIDLCEIVLNSLDQLCLEN